MKPFTSFSEFVAFIQKEREAVDTLMFDHGLAREEACAEVIAKRPNGGDDGVDEA